MIGRRTCEVRRFLGAALLAVLFSVAFASTAWAACTDPDGVGGTLIFNQANKKLYYCNDTGWVGVGGAGSILGNDASACTGGAGTSARLRYNGGNIEFCNGTAWAGVGSSGASQWTSAGSDIYYNTGNVGIGTTSPDAQLEIEHATNPRLFLTDTGARSWMAEVTNSKFGISDVTAAADRFTIDTSGNVGIGTTSPSNKFEVQGGNAAVVSTSGNPSVIVGAGGTTTGQYTSYGVHFGTARGYLDSYNSATSAYQPFDINASVLSLNGGSGGNVGIGTATPGAALEVAGQVKITGGTPGAGKVLTSDAAGLASWAAAGGSSQWTTTGSDIYYNTGKVGIGTTAPTEKLHVSGGNVLVANGGVLEWGDSGGTARSVMWTDASDNVGLRNNTLGDGGPIVFQTKSGGAESMRIDSAGNVGIGTTSPNKLLDVRKDQAAYTYVSVDNQGTAGAGTGSGFATGEGGTLYTAWRSERDGTGALNLINGNGGPVYFATGSSLAGSTTKMTILNAGNVGIGTTAPGYPLHIVRSGAGGSMSIQLENTNADMGGEVLRFYKNSASPANADTLGYLMFSGRDSAAAYQEFASLVVAGDDITDGSEDASWRFYNRVAGTETEVFTIKSGNVGIGTTSPATYSLLHLNSAATTGTGLRIENTDTGGRAFRLLSTGSGNTDGAGRFHIFDEGAGAFRLSIDSTGNVGIGTTSPLEKLYVKGGSFGMEYGTARCQMRPYPTSCPGGWSQMGSSNGYVVCLYCEAAP